MWKKSKDVPLPIAIFISSKDLTAAKGGELSMSLFSLATTFSSKVILSGTSILS